MTAKDTTGNSGADKNAPKPFVIWLGFGFCIKCFAFSILMIMLLLTVIFIALRVPMGIEPITFGESLALIYRSAIVPVLSVLGDILKSLSPWGVIVFVLLSLILWGPTWIRESLTTARWELGPFKYDGSALSSAFRKELSEAARIVEKANKEIGEAYDAAKLYAPQLRDKYQIGTLTAKLALEVAKIVGPSCPDDYRFTLYVPDFIFGDRLYQLTEYYDKLGNQLPGEVAGRTFSIRYGIIGRVWRSGVSEIEGELISSEEHDLLREDPNHGPIENFIARRWGLSLDEAVRIKDYNSYGAIRLNIAERAVGLVFFDSKTKNAFGDKEAMKRELREIGEVLDQSPILRKLLEISSEVAPWSGRIQIFRNS